MFRNVFHTICRSINVKKNQLYALESCNHQTNVICQLRLLSTSSSGMIQVRPEISKSVSETTSMKNELIIDDNFVKMLNRTLKKSDRMIDKQGELKKIIKINDNIFKLFYLLDNFHTVFAHDGLICYIKHLGLLLPEDIPLPLKIKARLTKLIIKCLPNYEATDCMNLFLNLKRLGFKLNDYAYHAAMQILKFHLNNFDLDDLIRIKKHLDQLNAEKGEDKTENEYADNLCKTLCLVVEIKLDDISNISTANCLMKSFGDDLSYNNLEKIKKYMRDYLHFHNKNKYKNLNFNEIKV